MDALTAARPVTSGPGAWGEGARGPRGPRGAVGSGSPRQPSDARQTEGAAGAQEPAWPSPAPQAAPGGSSGRPLSSSQVRLLVGWGLCDKEGLPDPVPGEGTRKTILAVKEARQCFRPSRRDREGLNIPGFPGDSPRKGRRGKVPFGLRQEARFSFKAVFVYVGPEGGGAPALDQGQAPWGAPPTAPGALPPTPAAAVRSDPKTGPGARPEEGGGPGCASGARPVSLSATPQRSRASPAPRRTGASWARSPSSWTGASWPTSSPG